MEIKLFESELKLMELVWEYSPVTAKELSSIANDLIGWNKNTTYTILKKLVEKQAIRREEPNFICLPLITRQQVQNLETNNLISRLFSGSKKAFFSAFISKENLTKEEIEAIKKIIDKTGDE